ncbi:MAG: hypothetical protein GX335_04535 [Firmicutes bacterium]|nr:hypothetical protein [Bacillota bacterium]
MSRRGVFFAFLLFFLLGTKMADAVQLKGLSKGVLNSDGVEQEFTAQLEKKWESLDLEIGWRLLFGPNPPLFEHELESGLYFKPAKNLELVWKRNLPHYTSPDVFRLIHKNNFTKETAAFLVLNQKLRGGFF